MLRVLSRFGIYLSWVIALVATLSSLYSSEVVGIKPCSLCWYQRICMFTLSITLGMAAYRRDTQFYTYIMPQVCLGSILALYQLTGYWSSSLWSSHLCGSGLECTEHMATVGVVYAAVSFVAFMAIALLMTCARWSVKNNEREL